MEKTESNIYNAKDWLKVYTENYEGKSALAKSLQDYMKETYTGASYIPWAVMERTTYMLDPNAEFMNVLNVDGGFVHTDKCDNIIVTGENRTESTMFAHFVKVMVRFMGKVFEEDMPIQDNKNEPVRNYTQNDVNNALKRGLAKVAAKATGIGWKLYENKDLQFEPKVEDKKPVLKNTKAKVETKEEVKVEDKKVELIDKEKAQNTVDGGETAAFKNGERTLEPQGVEVEDAPGEVKSFGEVIDGMIEFIKTSDESKIVQVFNKVNPAIVKTHNFMLDVKDDENTLGDKFSKFPEPSKFYTALQNLYKAINE